MFSLYPYLFYPRASNNNRSFISVICFIRMPCHVILAQMVACSKPGVQKDREIALSSEYTAVVTPFLSLSSLWCTVFSICLWSEECHCGAVVEVGADK